MSHLQAPRPASCFLIGGGWRAEAFLRIAQALPDQVRIHRMLVRDAERGRALERRFGIPTHRSLDETLSQPIGDFAVVCIGGDQADMIAAVAERGIPVLAETPPSRSVDGLRRIHERAGAEGWRIQVAEQYPFNPLTAAQVAVATSGRLGRVQQAHVSIAHGYHGLAVLRRLLGWDTRSLRVRAHRIEGTIHEGPGRGGLPPAERYVPESRVIATLTDDGGRCGIFDFSSSQYSGWIRSNRVQVRGDRGEISDTTVRWLADHRTPIQAELMRRSGGQDVNIFEGLGHISWTLGEVEIHASAYPGARLTDDELAIAECLRRMADFVGGGPEFYGLGEACHDAHLEHLILRCAEDELSLRSGGMAWHTT